MSKQIFLELSEFHKSRTAQKVCTFPTRQNNVADILTCLSEIRVCFLQSGGEGEGLFSLIAVNFVAAPC